MYLLPTSDNIETTDSNLREDNEDPESLLIKILELDMTNRPTFHCPVRSSQQEFTYRYKDPVTFSLLTRSFTIASFQTWRLNFLFYLFNLRSWRSIWHLASLSTSYHGAIPEIPRSVKWNCISIATIPSHREPTTIRARSIKIYPITTIPRKSYSSLYSVVGFGVAVRFWVLLSSLLPVKEKKSSHRALSAAERSENLTKPKPLGFFVVRSTEIVEPKTEPYLAKWSFRTSSVVSREMPPTNSFA
ncbi:Heterogeneous nuclear ribonucleoprotein 1 [Senna tora]|uniref:Heterogeneous nuclear ribonucleoprotein 1 n=1 Tax=Senna tora TaxID=362788 RepID=A0A834WRZ6_9FABA|nr:Heterogeneous nuclear ribonucleoprotein 1 [Senna tora]